MYVYFYFHLFFKYISEQVESAEVFCLGFIVISNDISLLLVSSYFKSSLIHRLNLELVTMTCTKMVNGWFCK